MFACTETVTDEVPSVTVNCAWYWPAANGATVIVNGLVLTPEAGDTVSQLAVEDPADHFNAPFPELITCIVVDEALPAVPCTVTEVVLTDRTAAALAGSGASSAIPASTPYTPDRAKRDMLLLLVSVPILRGSAAGSGIQLRKRGLPQQGSNGCAGELNGVVARFTTSRRRA
jgi:hypothetical protein